jgi:hypothetical protein
MDAMQVADLIKRFCSGETDDEEWDDFISVRLSDPVLETARRRCANLPVDFPPSQPGEYCGTDGHAVLRHLVKTLGSA